MIMSNAYFNTNNQIEPSNSLITNNTGNNSNNSINSNSNSNNNNNNNNNNTTNNGLIQSSTFATTNFNNNNNFQIQMNNYAALALVSSSSSSSTSTNNNNINNNQRGSSLLTANNNGLNLASGHITPPNSGLLNLNINNNNNNQNNSINLPQNLLNQLNAANLISNSAPSPNRQNNNNNSTINPFFRTNSTQLSTPSQQQQLSNLLQQQQQLKQKTLVGSNLMNFANTNSIMNPSNTNNLLNSTIARPQQQSVSQTLNADSSIPPLDLSDFPVLHRQSNSPFQQQQQQQQLQQQLQQLRSSNNSLNFNQTAPNSAPILSSSSAALENFMRQLASVSSSSSANLAVQNSTNNLLMNNLTNGLQFNPANLSQQSLTSATTHQSGKMWSNFGSNKDRISLKSQQSATDSQHQEFNIQQEDFPALPRPQSVHNKSNSNVDGISTDSTLKSTSNNNENNTLNNLQLTTTNVANTNMQTGNSKSSNLTSLNQNFSNLYSNGTKNVSGNSLSMSSNSSASSNSVKKGIIISPDGRISNVPPNMLLDQFGMVGLLAYLRAADREKDFFALALGTDLTALGLNLNSAENLYHSFLSPFSDVPCRLQDIDFPVPTEYIINCQIKEKLAPVDVTRYTEDTLFYLFYMNGNDLMQLQAATALYERDWRYHVEKRFWLTKVPGLEPQQKTNSFEKGVYTVFDVSQWRKLQLEMTIEYNKLAEKPQLPTQVVNSSLQTPISSSSSSSLPAALQQQLQQQQQVFSSALGSVPSSSASLASLNTNTTSASSF